MVPPVALSSAAGTASPDTLAEIAAALHDALRAVGDRTEPVPVAFAQPVASAPSLPEDLASLRSRASAALADVDTRAAIRLQLQLVEALQARLLEVRDVVPLVDAQLALAGSYLAADEPLLARAALDAAARLRPALDLDLRRHSPRIADAFDESKARVAREPPATVELAIRPDGALVEVDGVPLGRSPTSVQLAKGPHLVWSAAPGHLAVARVIELAPGSRARVDEALAEDPCFTKARALTAALGAPAAPAAEGARAREVALARALAACMGASDVVVANVVALPGGTAVSLAWIDAVAGADSTRRGDSSDGVRTGMASLPSAGPLAPTIGELVGALARARSDRPLVVRAAGAPDGMALLRPDFAARLLGGGDQPNLAADDGPLASPWLWAGVGVAGLALGGVLAVVLLQPSGTVTDPARTRVLVEVAR